MTITDALRGWTPWPEVDACRYRSAGYWAGRPLGDLVREWAARAPQSVALVDPDTNLTYGGLDGAADRLAAGLHALGLRPGDRVVVHLPNRVELVTFCVALFRLGAWPVLTLPDHREAEIGHVCAVADAVMYVVAEDLPGYDLTTALPALRARCPQVQHTVVVGTPPAVKGAVALREVDAPPRSFPTLDPSHPALLLLSGGSTGLPKLIPRTHDDYAYNARRMAEVCRLDDTDVYLAVLPAAHNFPLACPGILGTLCAGGRVVLAPNASPPEVFPLIARERISVTALVPPQAALWTQAVRWLKPDLSSLRLVQVGGSRLPDAVAAELPGSLGVTLQQVFGMAEGLLNATRLDDGPEVVGRTQGRPICPDDEVLIVDAAGAPVPGGGIGELLTRGPYTLRGYYRADEHNARAFTSEGFYRSGDLVRRGPGGDLVVTGRIGDQINRGGEKVSPDEVEGHLRAHPGIGQVVVLGVPDPTVGQRVCACVSPARAGDAAALDVPGLRRFLAGRGVAAYKQPERLELVETWPLTGVGKIDRQQLAARMSVVPEGDRS